MYKKIIFSLVAITFVGAVPTFAQKFLSIDLERAQQRQEFKQNREVLIDKDGNPINGYDDTKAKEDNEKAILELFEKIGAKIKDWFEKNCEAPIEQAKQKKKEKK